MEQQKPSTIVSVCANCGNEVEDKFCAHCGQKDKSYKPTLKEWAASIWDDFIVVDAKLINTLKALFKPGQLTDDWLAGKQMRFVHPVRVYVFISLIYALFTYFSDSKGNFLEGYIDGILNLSESGMVSYSSQIMQVISIFILPLSVLTTLIFRLKERLVVGGYFVVNTFSFITLLTLFVDIMVRVFATINIPSANYVSWLGIFYAFIFVALSAKKVYQLSIVSMMIKTFFWSLINLVFLTLIAQITFGFYEAHEQLKLSN